MPPRLDTVLCVDSPLRHGPDVVLGRHVGGKTHVTPVNATGHATGTRNAGRTPEDATGYRRTREGGTTDPDVQERDAAAVRQRHLAWVRRELRAPPGGHHREPADRDTWWSAAEATDTLWSEVEVSCASHRTKDRTAHLARQTCKHTAHPTPSHPAATLYHPTLPT